MKLFFKLLFALLLGFKLSGCSSPATSEIADNNVRSETNNLYYNLFELAEQGTIFGHHEALAGGTKKKDMLLK